MYKWPWVTKYLEIHLIDINELDTWLPTTYTNTYKTLNKHLANTYRIYKITYIAQMLRIFRA